MHAHVAVGSLPLLVQLLAPLVVDSEEPAGLDSDMKRLDSYVKNYASHLQTQLQTAAAVTAAAVTAARRVHTHIG
jgi:hypothetical protein